MNVTSWQTHVMIRSIHWRQALAAQGFHLGIASEFELVPLFVGHASSLKWGWHRLTATCSCAVRLTGRYPHLTHGHGMFISELWSISSFGCSSSMLLVARSYTSSRIVRACCTDAISGVRLFAARSWYVRAVFFVFASHRFCPFWTAICIFVNTDWQSMLWYISYFSVHSQCNRHEW